MSATPSKIFHTPSNANERLRLTIPKHIKGLEQAIKHFQKMADSEYGISLGARDDTLPDYRAPELRFTALHIRLTNGLNALKKRKAILQKILAKEDITENEKSFLILQKEFSQFVDYDTSAENTNSTIKHKSYIITKPIS